VFFFFFFGIFRYHFKLVTQFSSSDSDQNVFITIKNIET